MPLEENAALEIIVRGAGKCREVPGGKKPKKQTNNHVYACDFP
jgi:hypothetical protein